jgi:DNA-binding transcriptional ArsR family regulator
MDLAQAVSFFKILSDESRLRLLALLASQQATVDELAASLDLRPPTVSHHLGRLKELGLVRCTVEGTSHRYSLDRGALHALARDSLSEESVARFGAEVDGDAWEQKVLSAFVRDGRLVEIPASRKKRLVILRLLAREFEPGRRYPEKEVNTVLARFHPDVATLRRELCAEEHALLTRAGGVYWRVEAPS